jgi:hypothetical protein
MLPNSTDSFAPDARNASMRIKRAARSGDLPDRAPIFSYTGDEL